MSVSSPSKRTDPQTSIAKVIHEYRDLVRRIAYHLAVKLPANIDIDDLIQAGMIGLIDATKGYDSSQGASFVTYASIRIRGAMIDEMRRCDWVPRSIHRRQREVLCATHQIEQRTGRAASASAIAEQLHISIHDYLRLQNDSSRGHLVSLDAATDEELPVIPMDKSRPTPEELMSRIQLSSELAKVIKQLPDREQCVLTMYYSQELNLREIGELLMVSESRVCQIHGQAIFHLRACLTEFDFNDCGFND